MSSSHIAFEYNGEQHYNLKSIFHSSQDELHKQQTRGQLKIKLCKENGIKLIVIPYTVKFKELEEYITNKLK